MNVSIATRRLSGAAASKFHLCGDCFLNGECRQRFVTYVSPATIRIPEVRLGYQNYLCGLRLSHSAIIDWMIDAIRDFSGRYLDEGGELVPTPAIASLLTPSGEFWFRDQLSGGPWRSMQAVPRLRAEATGRWRLIGTTINIKEGLPPSCPPE